MRTSRVLTLSAALAAAALGGGTTVAAPPPRDARAWIGASNQHAQLLLDTLARVSPESAGQFGVPGLDEAVTNLGHQAGERGREATAAALAALQASRTSAPDPRVRQDLDILIRSAQTSLRGGRLFQDRLLPYTDVTALVFAGLRSLLDAQVAPERRPAAVVRLRKYAGLAAGHEPIAAQAMRLTRDATANLQLLPPARPQVERDLANGPILVRGLEALFDAYRIEGWREPFATLQQQLADYQQYVRAEILPRCRTDFRQPADLYAYALEQAGVALAPEPLAAMARQAFADIQDEMQRVASVVAQAHRLQATDYRDVIRALKKQQLVGAAIEPHYRSRVKELEAVIRRERLVTLPRRGTRIRIATEAEAAQNPAPSLQTPRLLGNTGEMGEFVLPLSIPAAAGTATLPYDDFTFQAASWTLAAHEARPGHDMQFATIVDTGVSTARALFAFNSTNVEGWGLYAEWMMRPYMSPEGQLVSLQFALMRAARAFLDPELHMGRITPDQARRVLREDVGLSDAMTEQEVERYMFRAPGQATSYFYGYTRLRELRSEVERAMRDKFNARDFHDFILAQGLLPPELLREAVLARFVP